MTIRHRGYSTGVRWVGYNNNVHFYHRTQHHSVELAPNDHLNTINRLRCRFSGFDSSFKTASRPHDPTKPREPRTSTSSFTTRITACEQSPGQLMQQFVCATKEPLLKLSEAIRGKRVDDLETTRLACADSDMPPTEHARRRLWIISALQLLPVTSHSPKRSGPTVHNQQPDHSCRSVFSG